MIRALVWKETREQGVIVGALAVLGLAVLIGIGILNAGRHDVLDTRTLLTDPGILAVVMLTITGGAVVGGTLFAAEKENGTATFLAMLPVKRRGVWVGKMLAGAGLVLVVSVVLFAAAATVGLLGGWEYAALWGAGLVILALATFAWGSIGSILSRSSLAAAGIGVVFLVLAALILIPLLAYVYYYVMPQLGGWMPNIGRWTAEIVIFSSALFALLVLPAIISMRLYTAPDRDRHRRAVEGPRTGKRSRRSQGSLFAWVGVWTAGTRAAVWMNIRQQRKFTLVLGVVGLISGLSMLIPSAPFAAVWPPVGLLLAVLVGVLGWYDEQADEAKRFWLERRLPVSRLWWAKVLVGGLACLLVTLVALAPVAVKAWVMRREFESLPSYLLAEYEFPWLTFLLVWPAYGFAVGHLVGMMFRKTVVAAAVALMVSAVAAAVWLPSLLGGGVHTWQVFAPLVAVFGLARVMAWACVASRIGTPRALGRLVVGGCVVLVAVGAALGYRVMEIPDDPAAGADVAFVKEQIPTFEANVSGQEYRRAGALLHEAIFGRAAMQEQLARRGVPTPVQASWERDSMARLPKQLATMLDTALEHGWQSTEENDRILATMFRTGWADSVEAGARLPLGTLEDARDLTLNSPMRYLHSINGADALLLARGLKAQHDGDPERFVADFALVLNLSRTVRNKSVQGCALAGRRMESRAVEGLQRWLERLRGRDDLLVQIDRLIVEHDVVCGNDLPDIRLADQVVLRNTFDRSGEVLRRQWRHADAPEETRQRMDIEADLVGVAWQMPWEKMRHERLIALGNVTGYGYRTPDSPFRGLPHIGWQPHQLSNWQSTTRGGFADAEARVQADRRAARLLVAIRRYELKHTRPPEHLAQLVPDFLPAVPNDPYTQRPFGYRLSEGEEISMESRSLSPNTVVVLTELGQELLPITGGLPAADDVRVTIPISTTEYRWMKSVAAGRPVLWSVGQDRFDDGGVKVDSRAFSGDLVYIPPPIPPEDRR